MCTDMCHVDGGEASGIKLLLGSVAAGREECALARRALRLKGTQPEAIRAIRCSWRRIAPQSEVIWAILIEDSPLTGRRAEELELVVGVVGGAEDHPVRLKGTQPEVIRAI